MNDEISDFRLAIAECEEHGTSLPFQPAMGDGKFPI
jgi:hypothetical protein